MTEIDELRKILKKHEERISKLEKLTKSNPKPVLKDDEKILVKLLDEGFFDKPKKLGDLVKKLKSQAKFNNKTNYTKILKKMTSDDKLVRKMVDHQWTYVRK